MACVGFKSFPEHWFGREDMYYELLSSRDVKKIILARDNPFEVCFSGERALKSSSYLKTEYITVKVRLPIPKLNSDLLRIQETYHGYEKAVRGQHVFRVAYEDLIGASRNEMLQQLFRFLEVGDEFIPNPLAETIRQSDPRQYPMHAMIENYVNIEFAFRHTSYGRFLSPLAKMRSSRSCTKNEEGAPEVKSSLKWAL